MNDFRFKKGFTLVETIFAVAIFVAIIGALGAFQRDVFFFNDVLQIQLLSIEVPQTYYNISKQYGNNFFTVVVSGNAEVINIPDGNYSNIGIVNVLNTNMLNIANSNSSLYKSVYKNNLLFIFL